MGRAGLRVSVHHKVASIHAVHSPQFVQGVKLQTPQKPVHRPLARRHVQITDIQDDEIYNTVSGLKRLRCLLYVEPTP